MHSTKPSLAMTSGARVFYRGNDKNFARPRSAPEKCRARAEKKPVRVENIGVRFPRAAHACILWKLKKPSLRSLDFSVRRSIVSPSRTIQRRELWATHSCRRLSGGDAHSFNAKRLRSPRQHRITVANAGKTSKIRSHGVRSQTGPGPLKL